MLASSAAFFAFLGMSYTGPTSSKFFISPEFEDVIKISQPGIKTEFYIHKGDNNN